MPYPAMMRGDDRLADRKADAHAAGLRAPECIEDMRKVVAANAGPIVGDGQANLHTVRFGADREDSLVDVLFDHRVRRVKHEIEQHLLKLHGPTVDHGQRRREIDDGRHMADQQLGAQ